MVAKLKVQNSISYLPLSLPTMLPDSLAKTAAAFALTGPVLYSNSDYSGCLPFVDYYIPNFFDMASLQWQHSKSLFKWQVQILSSVSPKNDTLEEKHLLNNSSLAIVPDMSLFSIGHLWKVVLWKKVPIFRESMDFFKGIKQTQNMGGKHPQKSKQKSTQLTIPNTCCWNQLA